MKNFLKEAAAYASVTAVMFLMVALFTHGA